MKSKLSLSPRLHLLVPVSASRAGLLPPRVLENWKIEMRKIWMADLRCSPEGADAV